MDLSRHRDRWVSLAILIWMVVMVSTPILLWGIGTKALAAVIQTGVLLQFIAICSILWSNGLLIKYLPRILMILPLIWFVEYAGVNSGIPFGSYRYTVSLQPQLLDVPLVIPFAWLMMLIPAWGISNLLFQNGNVSKNHRLRLLRAVAAALAFTAWDLFLDPQMVAWDFWKWSKPGAYNGIPASNFFGWAVISFLLSYFFQPDRLPCQPLLLIYAITWLLLTIGQLFFWKLPFSAVGGFLGMGGIVLWTLMRRIRWKQTFSM